MLDITRGRSLATTAPAPDRVGDESFPSAAQQPPGLTPGILTMYPGCTPRPRNKRVYDAACAVAEGRQVQELDASQIVPGMHAWCGGSFLTVADAWHMHLGDIKSLENQITSATAAHPFVLLRLAGGSFTTGWIIGELDTPVYVLAPTPDAIPAPGAEATEGESTAARESARG